MSPKELLDMVKKLETRLLEQMKIVKEREDKIVRLEEKLQLQTRQNCQIRELGRKIGLLCGNSGIYRETLSGLDTHNKRRPMVKRTKGCSIFIDCNILDSAPLSDNDSLYHYHRDQDRETTGGGPAEVGQSCQQEPIRRDSEFYSTCRYDRSRKRTHKKGNSNVSVLNVKHSRKVQERLVVTSQDKLQSPKQLASSQSLLDADSRKYSQSPKTDQIKTENTRCKRRKGKRKKQRRTPPVFSPCNSPIQGLVPPPLEGHERGSSAELVLEASSTRMSRNVSPQLSSVPQERISQRMSEMSGNDSSSGYSEAKGEQPHLVRQSISDRSLSSLAQALPAIPNPSADDWSVCSLVHVGSLRNEPSREREIIDLGEERIINVLI